MNSINLFWIVLSFVVVLSLTNIFRRYAYVFGLMDRPNERSSHRSITPRGAGAIFVLVWALYVLEIQAVMPLGFVLSSLLVGAVGLWDDIKSTSALARLCVHATAAAIFCFWVMPEQLDSGFTASARLLLLCGIALAQVWSTNIFNFMDGLNGLAGFQAAFLFLNLGLLQLNSSQPDAAQSNFVLVAAILGFLYWNFPRGRVFMGDVGSGFIGFLFMGSMFFSAGPHLLEIMLSMLVLNGIFIVDTGMTLTRRALERKRWWEAHCEHAYQRLVRKRGWTHPQAVALVMGFNAVLWLDFYLFQSQRINVLSFLLLGIFVSLTYYGLVEVLLRLRTLRS